MEKILELMFLSLYQKPNYDSPNKVVFLKTGSLLQYIEAFYQRPFEEMESALGKILKKHGFTSVAYRNDKGEVFRAWVLEKRPNNRKELVDFISKLTSAEWTINGNGDVLIFTGSNHE
jgi:hypothetical protein